MGTHQTEDCREEVHTCRHWRAVRLAYLLVSIAHPAMAMYSMLTAECDYRFSAPEWVNETTKRWYFVVQGVSPVRETGHRASAGQGTGVGRLDLWWC